VAVAVIGLEMMIAVSSGLGWIGFNQAWLGCAGLPVLLTGWWIMRGLCAMSPGPACNRLLAVGGVQLILFAVVFHAVAMIR
jgi:hypothetical protein